MSRIVVLVNPVSGRGRARAIGAEVTLRLRRRGHVVELVAGRDRTHAAELAAAAVADDVDTLVVCGGDGAVNGAAQAVVGSATALGIVACGTGNDIARALELPRHDTVAAVAVIDRSHRRPVDVLELRGADSTAAPIGVVLSVIAAGFDSRVADRAAGLTRLPGGLRYQVALLAELAHFRPVPFRVEVDGEVWQGPAVLVAVGNGHSYGGGMKICPAARTADGILEVTVLSGMSRRRLVRLFPTVYRGTHLRYPEVRTVRGRTVTLTAPATVYGDGDSFGALPVRIDCRPGALTVLATPP